MIPVIDLLVKHTWWNISLASVVTQIPLSGEVQTVCQALVASQKGDLITALGEICRPQSLEKIPSEDWPWKITVDANARTRNTSYIFIIFIYHISHFCGTVSTQCLLTFINPLVWPKTIVASRTSNRSSATQTSTWRSEPSVMGYGRRRMGSSQDGIGYVVLLTMVILSSLKDRLFLDPFFKWPAINYLLTGMILSKVLKTYMRSVKNGKPWTRRNGGG